MKKHNISPTCTVLEGDVLECLKAMPDGSVNVCVTSPPYWGLRSYLKSDDPLKSFEMGSEPTPAEYIAAQVAVFRECRRVLHPTGVLVVNIGDTYSSGGRADYGVTNDSDKQFTNAAVKEANRPEQPPDCQQGEPVGIPDMLKNALRTDGWRHRDTVIWAKPAPMPASLAGWRWERCKVKVKAWPVDNERTSGGERYNQAYTRPQNIATWQDYPGCPKCLPHGGYVLRKGQWRTTSSHEYCFMFVKSDRYFCDAAGVKEPATGTSSNERPFGREGNADRNDGDRTFGASATRNPRSVQTWRPEPCKFSHYAAFPSALPRFFIKAATSPKGCCPTCGTPWSPVVERSGTPSESHKGSRFDVGKTGERDGGDRTQEGERFDTSLVGYRPSCDCPPLPSVPCRVLDPYAGTGTTLAVAESMGMISVGIELNPKYVEMIRQRILYENIGSGKDIISGKKFF